VKSASPSHDSVTVCLLTWNGREHLECCLESLAEQDEPDGEWEVLILDNGSADGTLEWLERNWSRRKLGRRDRGSIRWLRSEQNTGFCVGNNTLAAAARGHNLVLLNNDTHAHPDWLAALTDGLAAAPADVAAVGGRIVDWGNECLDFAQGLMTFDGHAFQRGYGKRIGTVDEPAAGEELLFACGGNMIVRKESFARAGAFDPAYFAYLEDVDLGWRLWSGGERVLFVPDATVRHRSMATSNALGTFNRGLLFERNALRTAYKNFDDEFWAKLAPAIWTTFLHRTQTMLVENNSGGDLLLQDPYVSRPSGLQEGAHEQPGSSAPPAPSLLEKWRGWGSMGLARRGLRRLFDRLADSLRRPGDPRSGMLGEVAAANAASAVILEDPRSIAQLRAFSHFAAHLDDATRLREQVRRRRVRSDVEIFERFGLYLVPTYPGDDVWFAQPGFQSLLPDSPKLVELSLAQLME
jgi:GT2 family glycosyltransferase